MLRWVGNSCSFCSWVGSHSFNRSRIVVACGGDGRLFFNLVLVGYLSALLCGVVDDLIGVFVDCCVSSLGIGGKISEERLGVGVLGL